MAMKKLKAPPIKKLKAEMTKAAINEPYDDRPRISFKETELPEVKDWKIGETYNVIVQCEMMGSSVMDYGNDKGKIRAEFKIVGLGMEENNE